MILDTTFLIDIIRGKDEKVKQKCIYLDNKFITKSISTITLMELWRGAEMNLNSKKEKKKVIELIESLLIHPFNVKEAKKAAEIESFLIKKGQMIDLEDIMIAATAITRNESVLTRNVEHFNRIPNLKVDSY
ncbi:PIN domain-containing protein [archaeon]|jgi:tRNA(fMet)-specific endonuclease VapC|nr:PIN domain-containing protein [archaeon]MBT4350946.1 PIN domain-containing protein [archaeon]MBT4647637.1 PIN domain-containing protein [archaeon]MBT6822613.1 PIN domain-containing protein [archaeon]MBT7392798.1 PIN domain-containing protein [archaeon]